MAAKWDQKRVLITGATGFIGQHLVSRLRDLGALVRPSTSPTDGAALTQDTSSTPPVLTYDVRDRHAVQNALDETRPDIVFHLAAVGVTNPAVEPTLVLHVNTGGTVNLLDALRERDVDRVVLAGTSYEYGARGGERALDPFNAYSASKVAAWAFGRMYWRAYGLPVVIVRPFQVYGPGQSERTLIPAAMRAALSGDDFPMTRGEQKRDFVFAPDVADGMIAAAAADGIGGESLDLGTGSGTTVRSAVEQTWELAQAEGSVRLGALPYRTGTAMHLVADAEHTAQRTGWRAATPLREGLQVMLSHMKSRMQ